jgi:hypothetical protein
MLTELILGLREVLNSEQLRHLSAHLLKDVIQRWLPHLWHWAKGHIGDILEAIQDWF